MEALLRSMRLHIDYLRALEESERVRAACLAYLEFMSIDFYPERPDLFAELEKLAAELGGSLKKPQLRWKYAWIKPLFGWGLAKRAQLALPMMKWSLIGAWDKALHNISKRERLRLN
jgi:hypothetical protein